jgi:hypothetical protein
MRACGRERDMSCHSLLTAARSPSRALRVQLSISGSDTETEDEDEEDEEDERGQAGPSTRADEGVDGRKGKRGGRQVSRSRSKPTRNLVICSMTQHSCSTYVADS